MKWVMNRCKVLSSIFLVFFIGCMGGCVSQNHVGRKAKPLELYLLVGQSNMAGRGFIEKEDTLSHPSIYVLNADDEWELAKEPLHYDKKNRGVGPGFAFAKTLLTYRNEAQIGLIPAAVGGTKIGYWEPGNNRGLYEEALRKAEVAMKKGELKGLLWQQGESDANTKDAPFYKQNLINLMNAFRKDLGIPDLPLVIGGVGDFLKSNKSEQINQAIKETVETLENSAYSEPSTLGHIGDRLHFNSEAQRENGKHMAEAMIELLK